MDDIYRNTSQKLVRDGRISHLVIAEKAGLSPSACLRCVQDLKRREIINVSRAALNKLNAPESARRRRRFCRPRAAKTAELF